MAAAIFMVLAVVGAVWAAQQEGDGAAQTRTEWVRAIGYWVCTVIVAFEMAAGGIWDLLRIEYVRVVLTHLGYPLFLLYIIGVPRIPCAFVLLLPRFPRLKEWAYAGAFINYMGAGASHVLAESGGGMWAGPLVLAGLALVSWALRPAGRRLAGSASVTETRAFAWAMPVAIACGMLVVAFLTLPKSAPH